MMSGYANAMNANSMSLFCKFCYDSGRGDFDNHNTRSRDGKLACKYLASVCCTRCGENGHTVKYCRAKYSTDNLSVGDDWNVVTNPRVRSSSNKKMEVRDRANSVSRLGGAFSALLMDDGCSKCDDQVVDIETSASITWATGNKIFNSDKSFVRLLWADMVDDDSYTLSKSPNEIMMV